MKITVVKNHLGQEEVHKAGCADLKRGRRPYALSEALTMEAVNIAEMYKVYWECIDAENVPDTYPTLEHCWFAWEGEFTVKPCAKGLEPMADPDARKNFMSDKAAVKKAAAKPDVKARTESAAKSFNTTTATIKRAAKQDLAKRVLLAVSAMIEGLDGSEMVLKGMDKAEAARTCAQWLHHLPTGGEWPGILPRPERSEWK